MTDICLQAHSHHTGMASAERDGYRVTVAVVPKRWRKAGSDSGGKQKTRTVEWPSGVKNRLLALYEHERVQVRLAGKDGRQAALEALLGVAQEHVDEEATPGDRDDEDQTTPLVRPIPLGTRGTEVKAPAAGERALAGDEAADNPAVLVRAFLMLLAESERSWDQAGARQRRSPLLDWLLHLRLVKALEDARQDIRRGYVPREERLTAVRGRVVGRALAEALASGVPAVECRYDAFTLQTPELQVVASALDLACVPGPLDALLEGLGSGGRSRESGPSTAVGRRDEPWTPARVRREAVAWRRWLAEVPSLPVREAASLAGRMRVPASRPALRRLVEQAREVLLRRLHSPTDDRERAADWAVQVDTSRVWESVLAAGARRAGWEVKREPVWDGVWVWAAPGEPGTGNKPPGLRPDLVLRRTGGDGMEGEVWIVDAKYRDLPEVPGDGKRFGAVAQLYQMLAYARAFEVRPEHVRGRLVGLVLAYARVERESSAKVPWRDMRRAEVEPSGGRGQGDGTSPAGRPDVLLRLRAFQFPGVKALASVGVWEEYLAGLGEALDRVLGGESGAEEEGTGPEEEMQAS